MDLPAHMKKEPILQIGSDKIISRHVYNKLFTIRFPDRSEWKNVFQPERNWWLIRYRYGYKANKGTGGGVYCHGAREILVLF
jgi:hypothetical protein